MKLGRLILSPKAIEIAYSACLLSLLEDTIQIIKNDYIGNLSTWNKSNRLDAISIIHNDDYINEIQKTQKKTEKLLNIDNVILSGCILLFGKKLLKYSKKQIKQSIKKMRDEGTGDEKDLDQMLRSFVSSSYDLMKIIKQNLVYKTVKIIKNGLITGEDVEDIEDEVLDNIDSTKNSLNFAAKEQIKNLHINYSRYKLVQLGFYDYIWVDVGDSKVRFSHRVLNQKIMSWKDPTKYRSKSNYKWKNKTTIGGIQKQVGEDYNCRCGFIPILSDLE